jgi:hypothetical protein
VIGIGMQVVCSKKISKDKKANRWINEEFGIKSYPYNKIKNSE